MKFPIIKQLHIVVLAILFSVLIGAVSGIYCVQCSSKRDRHCRIEGMLAATRCSPLHKFCVTTVMDQLSTGESRVKRGCSIGRASGCRLRNGSYICKFSCQMHGCNAGFNFRSGDLEPAYRFIL